MANRNGHLIKPPLGTPINRSHPAAQGLVSEFTLGGSMYDSMRSTVGTAVNSIVWGLGQFGPCLKLGGANAYGRIKYTPSLDFSGGGPFTACGWMYFDGSDPSSALLAQQTNTPANYSGWMIWLGGSTTRCDMYINSATRGNFTLSGVGWHHIALTFAGTGGVYTLYDNGVSKVTSGAYTTAPANASNDIIVGAYYVNGNDTGGTPTQLFDQGIDDVRIYNRALTAQQIRQVMISPFAHFSRPSRRMIARRSSAGGVILPPYLFDNMAA